LRLAPRALNFLLITTGNLTLAVPGSVVAWVAREQVGRERPAQNFFEFRGNTISVRIAE
jgi:hypothetical protein